MLALLREKRALRRPVARRDDVAIQVANQLPAEGVIPREPRGKGACKPVERVVEALQGGASRHRCDFWRQGALDVGMGKDAGCLACNECPQVLLILADGVPTRVDAAASLGLVGNPFAEIEEADMNRVGINFNHDTVVALSAIHGGGFNLGLVMRHGFGIGKPRRLQGRTAVTGAVFIAVWTRFDALWGNNAPRIR